MADYPQQGAEQNADQHEDNSHEYLQGYEGTLALTKAMRADMHQAQDIADSVRKQGAYAPKGRTEGYRSDSSKDYMYTRNSDLPMITSKK